MSPTHPLEDDTDDFVPPACGPTIDRIQAALDGELAPELLTTDPHSSTCVNCRERIRAAQLLLTALSQPSNLLAVPSRLTDSVLSAVQSDRRSRTRRRTFAFVGALAAAVVVAVWVVSRAFDRPNPTDPQPSDLARTTPPRATDPPTAPAPHQPPIRINDQLAKTGDALLDSSRSLIEPAEAGPKVVAALTDSVLKTSTAPLPAEFGSARQPLAELPEAAKIGLEPVTGSAQKAFSRLLRDVGAIAPTKPKS